jgi:hypothetical protein
MQELADLQSCKCASTRYFQFELSMNQRLYKVGQRVDKWCAACCEERGHVVASVSVKGQATRVSCPICGTRGAFKPSTNSSGKSGSRKESQPYDWTHSYRVRQVIHHPIYGPGEVVALIEPKKMDVLFADRIRRLIHSRG